MISKKNKLGRQKQTGCSGNQSGLHFFSLASQVPATKLPVHHSDCTGPMTNQTEMSLDTLSCDLIGLRQLVPLTDGLSVCLSTLKACPDLVASVHHTETYRQDRWCLTEICSIKNYSHPVFCVQPLGFFIFNTFGSLQLDFGRFTTQL